MPKDILNKKPYYFAYEQRYKTVFQAGAKRWGHAPDDQTLYQTLKEWVADNHLAGKHIIEFACGEGACGVILSELGCKYRGVDIAPSAVMKAADALKDYTNVSVDVFDMVNDTLKEKYDAALDCMGLHMLVTDQDRRNYLKNAYASVKVNAPMLFYKESYRNDDHVVKEPVLSYNAWLKITGDDYQTPSARRVDTDSGETEVMLPLVPARANDKDGYYAEMQAAGFIVEKFVEMDSSSAIQHAASIYVRK